MDNSMFYEISPNSWEDAKKIGKLLGFPNFQFVFRGQASNEWGLKTSIERATEKYLNDFDWTMYFENQIIERFKSRAHQYIQSPPKDQDSIEWLSIIQHYGGPTRLLDFTESFYIASFFAIDSALEDSCVWAINEITLGNSSWLKTGIELRHDLNKLIEYAQGYISFDSDGKDLVLSIAPSRLNERLAIQKGKFLFPCNISKSFESNLCSTFDFPFDTLESKNATLITSENLEGIVNDLNVWPSIVKINLSKEWHREAIRDLYAMNIDSASLFPGLEGFARSLNFITQRDDYERDG
jgi:hypothetical protein